MRTDRNSIPIIPAKDGARPGATALTLGRVIYAGLILVVCGLAATLLLRQADDVASLQYEIRVLINQQEALRRKRTDLEGQIADLESLERIHELGTAWGFVRPEAVREIELVYTAVEQER